MKKVLSKCGFTLIELILVAAILSIIGLAVYGTFFNGINIWKVVTEESAMEDVNLFFDKISYDLRNSFKLTGMRFKGEKTKVSFPSKVRIKGKNGIEDSIGEISYYMDNRKKALIRNEKSFSEFYRRKTGSERILSEHIRSLEFKYYVYDELRKKYSWVTSWQEKEEVFGIKAEEQLPLIVKIEIKIPGNKEDLKFVRTVQVPAGCCWPYVSEKN